MLTTNYVETNILFLCMVNIQKRFVSKGGLKWSVFSIGSLNLDLLLIDLTEKNLRPSC